MSTPFHQEEARAVLCDLPPGRELALLHLLTCPSCRAWATDQLLRETGMGEATPVYDGIWPRLEERVPWLIGEAERRNLAVEALLVELLDQPDAERQRALKDSRFWSVDLLDLLIDCSRSAQPDDPDSAVALAGLAIDLTGHLRKLLEEIGSAQLYARAEILRANALRLQGRLVDAEDALGRAVCFLCWPFESRDRADYCRILGLLRWEQGRLDEAAALFRHAARAFGAHRIPEEEAASLVLLGLLSLEQGQPVAAVRSLQAGRTALAPEARPWLTVRAGLGLALAYADIGQGERAQATVAETWPFYGRVADEREHVRFCWLEAKICARTGRTEEAGHLLAGVKRKLLAERNLPETVLCSLDLAALLLESGRAGDLRLLLQDIEQVFAADEVALDVVRRVYQDFAAEEIAAAEATVRRVFRFRGYRVGSLPFA